ncbi:unnamed protein product [[Actinomadura] parvosata subsp. kistnae]|nr:unnamed protein product [Actinomadura parvosata subsp. kistnae]
MVVPLRQRLELLPVTDDRRDDVPVVLDGRAVSCPGRWWLTQ